MKKAFAIVGILIAVGLFILGCMVEIPSKKIDLLSLSDDGYTEYVGGDAYNIQIEASLRGGEIAGGKAARAIYFAGGAILFILSGIFLGEELAADKKKEEQTLAVHSNEIL